MFVRAAVFTLACLGMSGQALAQAAETAIILSGSGPAQGKAQRSLGSAVAGSIGAAANAVRSARGSSPVVRRSPARQAQQVNALPGDVDPLEKTDAPSYELANGASIRVSGGLRRSAEVSCEKPCPKP